MTIGTEEARVTARFVDEVSSEAHAAFGNLRNEFSLTSVAGGILGAVAGVSLAGAFSALKAEIHETAAAAVEQEKADTALANAMKATSQFSRQVFRDLTSQAGAIQQVTRFTDDQVESAQALAINLGVGIDKIEAYTRAATTLSVITGRDLTASMRLLTKAELGSEEALKRVIGPFTDLDDAVAKLGSRFDQVAAQSMGPYEKHLHDLDVQIDEAKERLGAYAISWEGVGKAIHSNVLSMQEWVLWNAKIVAGAIDTEIGLGTGPGGSNTFRSGLTPLLQQYQKPLSGADPRFMTPWSGGNFDSAGRPSATPIGPLNQFGFFGGGAGGSSVTGTPKELTDALKDFREEFEKWMGVKLNMAYQDQNQIPAGLMDSYNRKRDFYKGLNANDPTAGMDELPKVIKDIGDVSGPAARALEDFARAEQERADAMAYGEQRTQMFADNVVGSLQDMALRGEFSVKSMAETVVNVMAQMMASVIDQVTRPGITAVGAKLFGGIGSGGGGGGGPFVDPGDSGGGLGSPLLGRVGTASAYERRQGRAA